MNEQATSEYETALLAMKGPNGTLARLAHAWPAHNLGPWMATEAALNVSCVDSAAALANYIAAVIDAFACQTGDPKMAIFGHGTGVLSMVEGGLKARIAQEKAATKKGIILPGLGGPH